MLNALNALISYGGRELGRFFRQLEPRMQFRREFALGFFARVRLGTRFVKNALQLPASLFDQILFQLLVQLRNAIFEIPQRRLVGGDTGHFDEAPHAGANFGRRCGQDAIKHAEPCLDAVTLRLAASGLLLRVVGPLVGFLRCRITRRLLGVLERLHGFTMRRLVFARGLDPLREFGPKCVRVGVRQ